ncbi:hypothetical protein BDV36DRAFT_264743 [Aspergillus pseudocaelatus]|uniref:Uncharacterized protein n=1 Tax=Aspergillus pseudocaelatus TaxID=1825620 RepID=A0ABQ6WC29_9EURO|nr:hypothetical protein BDV36DRAFT_264743 [Aspergillus pseudocaelatus]
MQINYHIMPGCVTLTHTHTKKKDSFHYVAQGCVVPVSIILWVTGVARKVNGVPQLEDTVVRSELYEWFVSHYFLFGVFGLLKMAGLIAVPAARGVFLKPDQVQIYR